MEQLERPVDLLIAGPPCPPWAGNGTKSGQKDDRARVFERVLEWTVLLVKSGGLLAVALENVKGILQQMDGKPSFMDSARACLLVRRACP